MNCTARCSSLISSRRERGLQGRGPRFTLPLLHPPPVPRRALWRSHPTSPLEEGVEEEREERAHPRHRCCPCLCDKAPSIQRGLRRLPCLALWIPWGRQTWWLHHLRLQGQGRVGRLRRERGMRRRRCSLQGRMQHPILRQSLRQRRCQLQLRLLRDAADGGLRSSCQGQMCR
jgi:hypothetical protein